MTDAEIRDAAVAELQQTTVGWKNTHWTQPPAGTHWKNAMVLLAEIDQPAPPPPPPPPAGFAQLPQGTLTPKNTTQRYGTAIATVISRLDIEGIHSASDGLLVMQWPPKLTDGRFQISDIVTQDIGNVPPTSDGTSEAGIWIGQTVDLNRVVCDGSWEGLWTGAMCADSILQNITVGKRDGHGGYTNGAGASAGIYCEHFTRRSTFKNFDVHPLGKIGIISEWWYADSTYAPFVHTEFPDALAGKAGSCHNTYDTGRVFCPAGGKGVFLDAGTWGTQIRNVTFEGPGDAVWMPNHLAGPDPNVFDQASCTFNNGGAKLVMHNNAIGAQAPTLEEKVARVGFLHGMSASIHGEVLA